MRTANIFLLILMFIGLTIPINNILNNQFVVQIDEEATGGIQRPYHFRVELRQWDIKFVDLNKVEDLVLSGMNTKDAWKMATYTNYLGHLEMGSIVYLQLLSFDVQHGLSNSGLNVDISIFKTSKEESSSIPYFEKFILPNINKSFTLGCQIYCGIGHSAMKIKIDVGIGDSRNIRPLIFVLFYLNYFILIIFINKLFQPIERKVTLFATET